MTDVREPDSPAITLRTLIHIFVTASTTKPKKFVQQLNSSVQSFHSACVNIHAAKCCEPTVPSNKLLHLVFHPCINFHPSIH